MRSVFIFTTCSRDDVQTFLGTPLPSNGASILGIQHIVSVDFYTDGQMEMPELMHTIERHLEAPPLGLIADISGRIDGTAEATEFCIRILAQFGGFALDDYSDHLWTLSELETNAHYKGHHFFDTAGWYRDRPESILRTPTKL